MIHQYQNNGYNIVLDVNSGAVHVVDQEAYEVIAVLNEMNAEHTPGDAEGTGDGNGVERKARGQIYGGRPEGYSGCGDRADRAGKTLYKGYL